jgi:hypothetical protein
MQATLWIREDGVQTMENITLRFCEEGGNGTCPLCGETVALRQGPGLFLGDSPEAVCRECGKKNAPHLVNLLDLAAVAEKVGRLCRHLLTPPMEALLDLARAAENYSQSSPNLRARPN